jgi:hypothetical protein
VIGQEKRDDKEFLVRQLDEFIFFEDLFIFQIDRNVFPIHDLSGRIPFGDCLDA